MGLQSVLDLGKNALAHNQTVLQTIGHNIANAGVEGYTRQQVIATNNPPVQASFGFLGTGVRVETIRQIVDRFLNSQITRVKSELAAFSARSEALRLAETFLNEGNTQGGINSALLQFFLAAEELATRPEGAPERTALISAAENLTKEFNNIARSIDDLRIQANRDIVDGVNKANLLVSRIADLNTRIQLAEAGNHSANDLRDERQRAIEDLAQTIEISFHEDNDGTITVIVGNSFPIVQKGEFTEVRAIENPDSVVGAAPPTALVQVNFIDLGGQATDITSRITMGEIGGLLIFRDSTLADLLDDLDALAATFLNEVNILHTQGYGLDGSTNINFFDPLKLSVTALSTNSADSITKNPNIQAVLSDSRIFDPTAITGSNYRIEFTSATTFNIIDTDTGTKLDETKVSINGGPFGTDSSVTEFSYSGTQVSAEFEGVRVVIQNFAGAPVKGDSFTVSTREGVARSMAVNSAVATDLNQVAAAGLPGVPGDNATALGIANLRAKTVAQRDSSTLNDFLNSIISGFATEVRDVRAREDLNITFKDTLQEAREEISGVSIDEELANIVRFQQNFGATARLMSIAADLLQDVLEII